MAKTYKREVAIVVLLYLFYLGLYGNPEVVAVMVWPFMLYVGAAFGMDWARSQLSETDKYNLLGGSSRGLQSSRFDQEQTYGEYQRTGRQREQSSSGADNPLRGSDIVESRE